MNDNKDKNNLPLQLKIIKHDYQSKGVYWYCFVDKFIRSRLYLTNIKIKVREGTGWKTQWTKALLLQYKNSDQFKKSKQENI